MWLLWKLFGGVGVCGRGCGSVGLPSLQQSRLASRHFNNTPPLSPPKKHPQISDNKGNDLGQAAVPIALGFPLDGPEVSFPPDNPGAAQAATTASRGVFPPVKERVRVALSSGGVFKCVYVYVCVCVDGDTFDPYPILSHHRRH